LIAENESHTGRLFLTKLDAETSGRYRFNAGN